ncbi:MAG: DUF1826 domain-containing protein [Pseudomonadota bacterium]
MNHAAAALPPDHDDGVARQKLTRRAASGSTPAVLAEILQDDINIAIWERDLNSALAEQVQRLLAANPRYESSFSAAPVNARSRIDDALGNGDYPALADDIAALVTQFGELLSLKSINVHMATSVRATCPRFHVDMLRCRLLTTYQGDGTEWLPHGMVNRSKLGSGSGGKPDLESGLFESPSEIQRLSRGDVALLKGERWQGNANGGLVHRSPDVPDGVRLLLTLDIAR